MLRQQWETELTKMPHLSVDEERRTRQEQVETELTQINKGIVFMAFIVYYHCLSISCRITYRHCSSLPMFVHFLQNHLPSLQFSTNICPFPGESPTIIVVLYQCLSISCRITYRHCSSLPMFVHFLQNHLPSLQFSTNVCPFHAESPTVIVVLYQCLSISCRITYRHCSSLPMFVHFLQNHLQSLWFSTTYVDLYTLCML